jgi:tRNA(Ile)-lysidine synthase
MDPIVSALAATFQSNAVTGRTAVALSGGVDSMVLLDVAANIASDFPQVRLEAIHIHHGLSPNADAWSAFCQRQCDKRGVPLNVHRVQIDRNNTDGQGVEATARSARYGAFVHGGARFILAAQHADDQAETVLHQLLRGTGWAGMAGMGEARDLAPDVTLLRPFLSLNRGALETYAQTHHLEWVEDESNADAIYTRNFLRHRVLPVIAERFPHYRASLSRAARHAAETDGLLEVLAKIDLQWDGKIARAQSLDSLPLVRQVNALYHWLGWLEVAQPSRAQLDEWAHQLFRPPPADRAHQAGGHDFLIVRKRDVLALQRLDKGEAA